MLQFVPLFPMIFFWFSDVVAMEASSGFSFCQVELEMKSEWSSCGIRGSFVTIEWNSMQKLSELGWDALKIIGELLENILPCLGHFYSKFMETIGLKAPRMILLRFGLITFRFAYGRDQNSSFLWFRDFCQARVIHWRCKSPQLNPVESFRNKYKSVCSSKVVREVVF